MANKYIPATPGAMVAHIDKKRGKMTNSQFAETLGVSRWLIDMWRKGTNTPRPANLHALGLEPVFRVVDSKPLMPASGQVRKAYAARTPKT